MNRVTITLHLDLPDGVVPNVEYSSGQSGTPATAPAAAHPSAAADEPELPPIAVLAQQAGLEAAEWPAGKCPKHDRPWKVGNYGPYCSAKDPEGNERGYCAIKPGYIWNGRKAA